MRRFLITSTLSTGNINDNSVVEFNPELHKDSEAVKFMLCYTHPGDEYEMMFTNDANKATDRFGSMMNVSFFKM